MYMYLEAWWGTANGPDRIHPRRTEELLGIGSSSLVAPMQLNSTSGEVRDNIPLLLAILEEMFCYHVMFFIGMMVVYESSKNLSWHHLGYWVPAMHIRGRSMGHSVLYDFKRYVIICFSMLKNYLLVWNHLAVNFKSFCIMVLWCLSKHWSRIHLSGLKWSTWGRGIG